jgi:serine/threonine protein kinase
MSDRVDVGDVLMGRYRLDRFIASGSMGLVFEATDLSLGRQAAIKIARCSPDMQEELERRLYLEARAAAKLRGEHVAAVFEIGTLPSGAPFMVMEYLDGENLEDLRVRRGTLPVKEAVGYAMQTCVALAMAHSLGIVHRDIKPENLFLTDTPDGRVVLKVVDFGASAFQPKHWQVDPSVGYSAGTPLYMSPERFNEPTSSDPRSDIWALGAVLYELIAGVAPFDAPTVEGVRKRTLYSDPAPLCRLRPHVSPFFDGLVMRCLDKNPWQRFADVAALASALSAFGPSGSHELAARVRKITSRTGKAMKSGPRPIAEHAPPRPRAPMVSEPLLLTNLA